MPGFQIIARRRRTTDYQFTLYEADGSTGVVLAATDVVRVKIGNGDGITPDLDLKSGTVTVNGSTVTIDQITTPAKATLRLAEGDVTALTRTCYEVNLIVADDSETAPANAVKHAESGILVVLGQLGGDVGL